YRREAGPARRVPIGSAGHLALTRLGYLLSGGLLRPALALALPACEPGQVARDPFRIDLAAWQMHVRVRDQPVLIGCQRHPLRQHIVGIGQSRAPVRPRVVGERNAVLAQQRSRSRHVRDDRLVRGDQGGISAPGASVYAQKPEIAIHRPLLLVHAGAQQLARTLLGTTLPARVVVQLARSIGVANEKETDTFARTHPRSRNTSRELRPAQLPHE